MSRYTLITDKTKLDELEIVVGWDVQFQTYFAYVEQQIAEDEIKFILDIGDWSHKLYTPVAALKYIEDYIPGISEKEELIYMLELDKERQNSSTDQKLYIDEIKK